MKKKKGFLTAVKIILIVLAIFLVIVFLGLEVLPRVLALRDQGTVSSESSDWMADLDDSMYLSDISIPGIHDATTANIHLAAFAQCQGETIATLLSKGYRYLDMRLGIETVDGKEDFCLYHSFLKCMEGNGLFGKYMTFDSILKDCESFLDAHPTETIIMVIKQENGDQSTLEFQNFLAEYLEKNLDSENLLLTDHIPTLKEARGKIVIFRRFGDEAGLGEESGISIDWGDQGNREIIEIPYASGNDGKVTYWIQDRYNYDAEDKWNAFKDTLDATESLLETEETDEKAIVVNFLSTSGSGSLGVPLYYAWDLNKRFVEEYSGKTVHGWVILDFGTEEMAKIIYQSNYQ